MDNADLMYSSLQRGKPFLLSTLDEEDAESVVRKIINFKVDIELKRKGIKKPKSSCSERKFDEYCRVCESISDYITIASDSQVVSLCSYKGEGMGFALLEDVEHLPEFVSKEHSFNLFDC